MRSVDRLRRRMALSACALSRSAWPPAQADDDARAPRVPLLPAYQQECARLPPRLSAAACCRRRRGSA